jgi:phosphohistidine swiveling domain-containing protein
MVIDLQNFYQYDPGTEANILFRLQEHGFRVPPFFCVTEDVTEEELNHYLSNHHNYTAKFVVRLSCAFQSEAKTALSPAMESAPRYVNIQKSILFRQIQRVFAEANIFLTREFAEHARAIHSYVIIQEMTHSDFFGCIQTDCHPGATNETVIYAGLGHDSNFSARGIPFSIYAYNNDDRILFAREPEGAVRFEKPLLKQLFTTAHRLKEIFQNASLKIKFIVDAQNHQVSLITVQSMRNLLPTPENEIVLDTHGLANYYPGVTLPATATMIQVIFRSIAQTIADRIPVKTTVAPDDTDLLFYVNGRLYFHVKRFERLQKVLYLENEVFTGISFSTIWKQLRRGNGLGYWRRRYRIAKSMHALLEENLSRREAFCEQMQEEIAQLKRLADTQSPYQLMQTTCDLLTKCMYTNLLNTLYVNMNGAILAHARSGSKRFQNAADAMEAAKRYRSALRGDHATLHTFAHQNLLRIGEKLAFSGCIDAPEDIFYFSYKQIRSLRIGSVCDYRQYVEQKKREFTWYQQMPDFTRLTFHTEALDSPLGVVDFLGTLEDSFHLRGSGQIAGHVRLPAVICHDDRIPEDCSTSCIYITHKIPRQLAEKKIGGLLVEEADVFANQRPEIAACRFPIVVGIRHICTLIQPNNRVEIDGATGDVIVETQT